MKSVSAANCDCSLPCVRERFEPSLSFAQLSKLNIKRLVLQGDGRKENVEQQFFKSSEVLQRAKAEILTEDEKVMSAVLHSADLTENALTYAAENTINYTMFATSANVMDALGIDQEYIVDLEKYLEEAIDIWKEISGEIENFSFEGDRFDLDFLNAFTPNHGEEDNYIDKVLNCEQPARECVQREHGMLRSFHHDRLAEHFATVSSVEQLEAEVNMLTEFLGTDSTLFTDSKTRCSTAIQYWHHTANASYADLARLAEQFKNIFEPEPAGNQPGLPGGGPPSKFCSNCLAIFGL